jgi:tetratricopeptide (TPR) repeat protein
LLAGRLDDATEHATAALAVAQNYKERGHEAWALRLLGEIAAHGDPPHVEQAEDHYHHALSLAEALGARPLAAHCHRGLGTLYRRVGRHESARAELAIAADMYRTMEMTFWLSRAETELGQIAFAP